MAEPATQRPISPIFELPEPPRSSFRAGTLQWAGLVAIALVAITADQLTKAIATRSLELGRPSVLLDGWFDLTYIHNTGIAFGQFTGQQSIVMVLEVIAIAWMVVFFARTGARHPAFPVAVGLLVGGASSNLFDRLRSGSVTDFLHLHHWPIFNLADVCVVAGVALLLLGLSSHERKTREAA